MIRVTFSELQELQELQERMHKHEKRVARRKREKARKDRERSRSPRDDQRETEKLFNMCKGSRMRKRVHNDWSTEQAGRGGASCIHENRFAGSYIHVVSKSRIK